MKEQFKLVCLVSVEIIEFSKSLSMYLYYTCIVEFSIIISFIGEKIETRRG